MKWMVVILLIGGIFAQNYEEIEIPEDVDLSDSEEDDSILREMEIQKKLEDIEHENWHARDTAEKVFQRVVDPCDQIHCGAGRICQAKEGSASCVCIPECPEEYDPRRKVCTNLNETWASDCEVHRQRCFCDTKDARCIDKEHSHMHIDYFGECRELPSCTPDERLDFPRRMREWLSNVMADLADREELSKTYIEMNQEARKNLSLKWSNAAIWKWCDLDEGHDNSVSRHELFPIRAPLVAMEHCIAPFLEDCDQNKDHRITLQEWGKCLELEDGLLEARCESIQN